MNTKKSKKISKNAQISTNSGLHFKKCAISTKPEVKTKKKVFIPQNARITINSEVKPQNQTVFIAKCTKKQFLLTNSGMMPSILGVSSLELHSSSSESVNFFGAQFLLGGAQFSFEGEQTVIWGGAAPECPRGAGPALGAF